MNKCINQTNFANSDIANAQQTIYLFLLIQLIELFVFTDDFMFHRALYKSLNEM